MIRSLLKYSALFILVILTGAMLMDVTRQVQEVEYEIALTKKKIENEEEAVRILKAEWAYLNDPARLEGLVSKGLEMSAPEQRSVFSQIPDLHDTDGSLSDVSPSSSLPFPSVKPEALQVKSPLFVETSSSLPRKIGGYR